MKAKAPRKGNFTRIPNLFFDLELPAIARTLYLAYVRTCGSDGRRSCTKSPETLAAEAGIAVRTVSKARKILASPHPQLDGHPLISIVKRHPKSDGTKQTSSVQITDLWNFRALPTMASNAMDSTAPYATRKSLKLFKKEHGHSISDFIRTGESSIPTFQELKSLGYDEDQSKILAIFNHYMPENGYLPVNAYTDEVVRGLTALCDDCNEETAVGIMREAIKEGRPGKGEATFVRMCRNFYE